MQYKGELLARLCSLVFNLSNVTQLESFFKPNTLFSSL